MEKKSSEIKTAYEKALERLGAAGEPMVRLTPEQKAALAEVDARVRAKIAEVEILMDRQIAEARARADIDRVRTLTDHKQAEIRRIREEGEREKEKIRRSS